MQPKAQLVQPASNINMLQNEFVQAHKIQIFVADCIPQGTFCTGMCGVYGTLPVYLLAAQG